ncbi:MAG: hypothetical protein IPI02_20240 [Sterolibacteriaceae bacterium]|nr:hypothetical protein [Sterolibacteriaceae bacterium]
MLTSARIEQVLKPQGMDWVSSLRAPQIAQLAAEHGPFQPSLFDERNLLELTSQHFPDERLVPQPLAGRASARKRLNCWQPPRPIWPRLPRPRAARATHCVASRPLRCAWGASSGASTWPSIWR